MISLEKAKKILKNKNLNDKEIQGVIDVLKEMADLALSSYELFLKVEENNK